MGIWQVAIERAKAAAYVSAAGLTLFFAAPIGGYLLSQHFGKTQEFETRSLRHAEIYSRRIEQVLGQASTATTLLAESFHNFQPGQLSRAAAGILKIVSPASYLEITPDGQTPTVITRRSESRDELLKPSSGMAQNWEYPVPVGEPSINLRGQQLLITQSLVNRSTEGRTHYWGQVSIALNFPAIAESTQVSELVSEGLAIRVSHLANRQAMGTVLFDSMGEKSTIMASRDSNLPGDSQLRVEIAQTESDSLATGIAPWLYLIIGSLVLFLVNLRLLKRPNQLEREVRLRTQLLDDEKKALKMEIEGRREAERMLERSHRLLDSIFEHIPGMIVLKRANDRRIARINRSGEQILNRSRQSLIGRSNDEIYDIHLAGRLNNSDDEVLRTCVPVDLALEQVIMPGQPGRWVKMRKTVLLG